MPEGRGLQLAVDSIVVLQLAEDLDRLLIDLVRPALHLFRAGEHELLRPAEALGLQLKRLGDAERHPLAAVLDAALSEHASRVAEAEHLRDTGRVADAEHRDRHVYTQLIEPLLPVLGALHVGAVRRDLVAHPRLDRRDILVAEPQPDRPGDAGIVDDLQRVANPRCVGDPADDLGQVTEQDRLGAPLHWRHRPGAGDGVALGGGDAEAYALKAGFCFFSLLLAHL